MNGWKESLKVLHSGRVILLFLFAGFIAYGNAIFHPFVHDDIHFIVNNPSIRHLNFIEPFLGAFHSSLRQTVVNAYYRPLIDIFHQLQYFFFGLASPAYHVTNILFHVLNAILSYYLMSFVTGCRKISFLIGALFLVHPVQTEAVACVSGISNILFTTMALLSLIFYCRSSLEGRKDLFVASWVMFVVGLFVKEQMIVVPGIFILYEYFFKRFGRWRRILRILFIFAVIVTGYLFLREWVTFETIPIYEKTSAEFWLRIQTIPRALLMYIRMIFWPNDLHYYRSLSFLTISLETTAFFGVLLGVLFFWIHRLNLQDRALAFFGLCWFFVFLLPTLNIVPLVNEYDQILFFDHFLYLPMCGLLLMSVILLRSVTRKLSFKLKNLMQQVAWGMVICACIISTSYANRFWRSEIALFERAVKYEPETARLRMLLGKAYFFDGKIEDAIEEYWIAEEILQKYIGLTRVELAKNFYLSLLEEVWFDLGQYYQAQQKMDKAEEMFRKVLTLNKENADAYNNLSVLLMHTGRFKDAEDLLRTALKYESKHLLVMNNLAICLINQNRLKEAQDVLKDILRKSPHMLAAKNNLRQLRNQMERSR